MGRGGEGLASFPGLHAQLLSLPPAFFVLQATKTGRGGLGTRLERDGVGRDERQYVEEREVEEED